MSIDKTTIALGALGEAMLNVSQGLQGASAAKAVEALIDAKLDARLSPAPVGGESEFGRDHPVLTFDYTNYRGERSTRHVIPDRIWFGSTSWHPEPQWLLSAVDLDKDSAQRDFALVDMRFAPTPPPAEPDGGDARKPSRVAHDLGWLRGKLSLRFGGAIEDLPVTPDGRSLIGVMREAGSWLRSIADLEQRLADTTDDMLRIRAVAEATMAERDRRIADLEAGSLSDFWTRHAAWSNATFGDEGERGPLGPLRHLEKEVKEAQDAPGDILEYADCLLLVLDAVRRAGFTLPDLIDASNRKFAICQTRVWPKTAKDQAVEHVRSPATDKGGE